MAGVEGGELTHQVNIQKKRQDEDPEVRGDHFRLISSKRKVLH